MCMSADEVTTGNCSHATVRLSVRLFPFLLHTHTHPQAPTHTHTPFSRMHTTFFRLLQLVWFSQTCFSSPTCSPCMTVYWKTCFMLVCTWWKEGDFVEHEILSSLWKMCVTFESPILYVYWDQRLGVHQILLSQYRICLLLLWHHLMLFICRQGTI